MVESTQQSDGKVIVGTIHLPRILARTLTLQRLFVDPNIIKAFIEHVPNLHSAMSRLTSLSVLAIINQESRDTNFFWDIELGRHVYDFLPRLQVLIVGDVTINDPEAIDFLPLVDLKDLVFICP
ncbi:hypothetical protein FRB94_012094 [Tulasnella sp. JGI-2019a]|nr:hypothetical protein FRB93_003329 [Tulasnella sp. JGI-2019a]KAG8992007.1 hypothetical protein FRB94_012094 [Tulasnella sp. JGI-2019a]